MNRRQKVALGVGGAVLVVGGALAGILATRPPAPHHVGLTIYTVPSSYLSSGGVSSNQCAGVSSWTDANNLYEDIAETGSPHSGTFTVSWNGIAYTTSNVAMGATVTSFSVTPTTNGPITSGETIDVTTAAGGIDTYVTSALVPQGSTTIPVVSQTAAHHIPSGSQIEWVLTTTSPIAYNVNASTLATDVAGLDPSLSGVTPAPYADMPQTFTGNGPLNTNDIWLSGVTSLSAGVGSQYLTVDDSGIHSGHVNISGAGLIDILRSLSPGTEADFATDGCYEINGGLIFHQGDPTLSLNGNPSATSGQNAFLYDGCTVPGQAYFPCLYADQAGASGLGPVVELTYPTGTNDPSTVEHLQLFGTSGGIYNAAGADQSGILLLGTAATTVNDVDVEDVHGDCMTLQPDAAAFSYRVTNLVVENFSGEACSRQGIAPISVNGAIFCGTNLGASGQPSSWDFENDTVGGNQGAENVTITGLPCDINGVVSAGCSFKGSFNVSTNPAQSGPVLVDDCTQPSLACDAEGGLKIAAESSTSSVTPKGAWTFSHDSFKCFASIYGPCFHIGAPFSASLRSSILEVGSSTSNTQLAWEASDHAIGGTTYAAHVQFSTDCIAGFVSNMSGSPPGGQITGTLSTFTPVNVPYPPPAGSLTGYMLGSKTLCTVVP